MSMQPRPNRLDGRRRYTHQAYDVTYFGKAIETGPSGINMRLQGTHSALITMTGLANAAGVQRAGDLTSGLIITGLINHVALSAGTTVRLELPAWRGKAAILLHAAAPLTALGVIALTTPVWLPLDIDRPLNITFAGGSAQTAIFSLEVAPILEDWH